MVCSRCHGPRGRPGRYCHHCHAAYMRNWRLAHPLTEEQRRRDNCRSYTGVYVRRGKLVRQPCRVCGSKIVQAHHRDYNKPLEVEWVCAEHHRAIHRAARGTRVEVK